MRSDERQGGMLLRFDGVSSRQETRRILTWLRGSAAFRGKKVSMSARKDANIQAMGV